MDSTRLAFASTYSGGVYNAGDGRVFTLNGSRDSYALSIPAFYSGLRFISETLACLPKHVMQKVGQDRQPAEDHYLDPLISEKPNDLVNAAYLWETIIANAAAYGNGYGWVERRGGKVSAIYSIHPYLVRPRRVNGKQFYLLLNDQGKVASQIAAADMIHLRNYSDDGEEGVDVIRQLARTLHIGKSLDDYLGKYFERGTATNLAVELEGKVDKDTIDTVRYGIETNNVGIDNAHNTMIVANGTVKNLTCALKDFALDVLKESNVNDIARCLRIPPHVLYQLSDANYNTLEALGTELAKYSFTPWCVKLELECKYKLLTEAERADGYFVKWDLEGLQRGDYQTRVNAGVSLVNNRLMSPNEWRRLEDLPTYDGGDEFYGPLNSPALNSGAAADATTTIDPASQQTPPEAAADGSAAATVASEDVAPLANYGKFLADARKRVLAKQSKAFASANEKKEGEAFSEWLARFADAQGVYLGETLNPFLETVFADAGELAVVIQTVVEDYAAAVKAEREAADPQAVIDKVMKRIK